MARYIEADLLKKRIDHAKWQYLYENNMVKRIIDDMPSADVVPVVRCKDCRYWTKLKDVTDQDGNPVYDCPKWPEDFYWADEDGFCSGGVKRSADVSTADVISRELYKQVCWERDEAIKALEAHGLSLGQK